MFEAVVILCLASDLGSCEQPRELSFPVTGNVTPYQCAARVLPELASALDGGKYRVGRWTCRPIGKDT